jgi:hypothetical protein
VLGEIALEFDLTCSRDVVGMTRVSRQDGGDRGGKIMRKDSIALLTIATLSVGIASGAAALRSFSARDIRGSYAFSFHGDIVGLGPVAAVGAFQADGRGNLTDAVRTISVNGLTARQTFHCSLSVNPDGTGTASCPLDDPLPGFPGTETFDFALQEHANGFRLVGTTPGVVVIGEGKRQ